MCTVVIVIWVPHAYNHGYFLIHTFITHLLNAEYYGWTTGWIFHFLHGKVWNNITGSPNTTYVKISNKEDTWDWLGKTSMIMPPFSMIRSNSWIKYKKITKILTDFSACLLTKIKLETVTHICWFIRVKFDVFFQRCTTFRQYKFLHHYMIKM